MPQSRPIARVTMAVRWSAVVGGLFAADRAFAGGAAARVPRLGLLLMLYVLAVAGARLGAGAALAPEARVLAMNDVDAQLGSLMASAPAEAQAQARQRMLDAVLGRSSRLATAFSLAGSGLAFLLLLAELWLASLVVTQFFGGQEERSGPVPHPSLGLFLVAFLPLGLRRLAAGAISALRSPGAALNALTLQEYRSKSAVRFDLASLAGARGLPPLAETFLRLLTDPFVLWTLAILALGGRQVFRLPLKASAAQVLVLVAILGLQTWLLGLLGIRWEI